MVRFLVVLPLRPSSGGKSSSCACLTNRIVPLIDPCKSVCCSVCTTLIMFYLLTCPVHGLFLFSFFRCDDWTDPADELMPLSCEGRRWELRLRGTIDDALGYVAHYSYPFIFYHPWRNRFRPVSLGAFGSFCSFYDDGMEGVCVMHGLLVLS